MWDFSIIFADFVECTAKGSHYLRHHQHSPGTISWKNRDNDPFFNVTEVMVRQREDTKIVCDLTNGSVVSKDKVRWFHNDLEVDFGHRYLKDSRTGQVTIMNVRFEDGGIWHCQDRDSGMAGYPVHVIVLGKLILICNVTCEKFFASIWKYNSILRLQKYFIIQHHFTIQQLRMTFQKLLHDMKVFLFS